MGIMLFQQTTGVNAMISFTVDIFRSAGSSLDSNYSTIIIGFIQLIFTVLAGFLVDHYQRRSLLLSSAAVVSCSLAAMGSFFYFQREWGATMASERIGWLPLTSLVIFFISYSCRYATLPFILMAELFPSRYRATLGAISSSFSLICTFTVVRCFPTMQNAMGQDGVFWFFMTCTLVGIFFVYFLLPETKGVTLEDIEKLFPQKYKENEEPKMESTIDISTISHDLSKDIKTASLTAIQTLIISRPKLELSLPEFKICNATLTHF